MNMYMPVQKLNNALSIVSITRHVCMVSGFIEKGALRSSGEQVSKGERQNEQIDKDAENMMRTNCGVIDAAIRSYIASMKSSNWLVRMKTVLSLRQVILPDGAKRRFGTSDLLAISTVSFVGFF